jgi:hypothetical protein
MRHIHILSTRNGSWTNSRACVNRQKGAIVSPFVLVGSGETFTLAGAASWENASFGRPSRREAAAFDHFNLKVQNPRCKSLFL